MDSRYELFYVKHVFKTGIIFIDLIIYRRKVTARKKIMFIPSKMCLKFSNFYFFVYIEYQIFYFVFHNQLPIYCRMKKKIGFHLRHPVSIFRIAKIVVAFLWRKVTKECQTCVP